MRVVCAFSVAAVFAATGCRFFLGDEPCDDGRAELGDGICLDTHPTEPLQITGRFVTDNDPRCVAYTGGGGDGAYCVVAGTDVIIAGMFVGSRPLVVIALDSVTVVGRIDVSARIVGDPPAGTSQDAACDMGALPVEKKYGAAGGSFGGRGGDGGRSDGLPPCTDNCTAGAPIGLAPPTALRGGCRGQSGAVDGAHGGLGGGAVAIIAGSKIDITSEGSIDASGAGGSGGHLVATGDPYISGGGGGGSGGMIVLDAPELDVAGLVFADGGGGGEGSTDMVDGVAGAIPNGQASAPGGASQLTGGDGGGGSHAGQLIGDPGATFDSAFSGGGGGGGGGVIWVNGALNLVGGALSPAPTVIGS